MLIVLGSKYISKSEDNLLTPQCDSRTHRVSWTEDTPLSTQAFGGGSFTDSPMNMRLKSSYMSEPAIVASKLSPGNILPIKLCCASSAESLESIETQRDTDSAPLKIPKNVTELGAGMEDCCSSTVQYVIKPSESIPVTPKTPAVKDTQTPSFQAQPSLLGNEENITFGQTEIAALTPLHIDSAVFESSVHYSPVIRIRSASFSSHGNSSMGPAEMMAEQITCSRFIDALDVQSPAHFTLSVSSSTPYKVLKEEPVVPNQTSSVSSKLQEMVKFSLDTGTEAETSSPTRQEAEKRRVADHIQHFNKLTLYSPTGLKRKQIRSPLKFQRTPVRQTVRRINSLSGDNRRFNRNTTKSLSLESGLSPHSKLHPPLPEQLPVRLSSSMRDVKKPPPVPPKRPSCLIRKPMSCALGDMTNKAQPKVKVERSASISSGALKNPVQQVVEKDMNYYRGSPRNPLIPGRLLSATKPVDL